MRKNAPRKWLHAILDLLPVILIPVFMIYSHRHDVADDFIVTENVPVYYETNEVSNIDDLVVGNVYRWNDNYTPSYIPTGYQAIINIEKTDNLRMYVTNTVDFDELRNFSFILVPTTGSLVCQYYDSNNTNRTFNLTNQSIDFVIKSFASYFNNTSYLISHISSSDALFVKEYQVVTTEIPHDVMSSFVERLNITVDKYFNMDNAFNLNEVHQWFNNNIFNGQPPLSMNIVWHIIAYELLMDLMFLLYSLFMWFVDWCKSLIERTYDTSRGK